ncbi:hypothetical protein LTR10_021628 [Elasticomyces elasticus]|uniref:Aldehyde dehydrogenase domain-containing protein n=1 Tax=Exophiala sideris TaxID=1016849 RepID=A0ABR0J2A5_9EURO|nr:hypothetical protein LTR10_021628 [Elasticomyces elasticus]KAK5024128.1 hypothetical protein LTS07_008863 [Exophiala sideris]KAK5029012.1 hypothetical protein LTR13_008882 [Exophiala sideris]KAK5054840.1 hypothetical protein LTR69_008748 [Exophiala sideris]KAK5178835.1 hypothetical protein LTR44_008663 [Eurotiomycetes sp. CCFEE 6388]
MSTEYQTINPTTGQVEKDFPEATDKEVSAALDKAHHVYENDWRHRSIAERGAIVAKAATLLRQSSEELSQLMTHEMGKLIAQSRLEVNLVADIMDYYAKNGEKFLAKKEIKEVPGAIVTTEPIGVILAIEPWNFPFYQLARVAAPQLVAGNVVMMKPAPSVPQCALAYAELFRKAGAPEGAYTNIFATIPQVDRLIDDFRVRGVTLTGSERAGAAVGARAGKNLKKVVLELGGSDPLIVLPDADLEHAIMQGVIGRLMAMGQACASSKRYIVVGKDRAKAYLDGVTQVFGSLQPGDPAEDSTNVGPVVSERSLNGLLDQIETAKANGARIVLGGKRIQRSGFYLEPTIITDITPENPLFQQETFGPIASFYAVETEEEAIKLANATKFGLGATVFGSDVAHAQEVASKMESGMVWVNSFSNSGPALPFGGVKNSGFGRELSEFGIGEFVNHKLIQIPV